MTLYGSQGDAGFEAGSDTSRDAAQSIAKGLAPLEKQVFLVLAERPRTCDAVEVVTGLPHQTVSARIRGLALRGAIVKAGWKALTRSGREADVWRRA